MSVAIRMNARPFLSFQVMIPDGNGRYPDDPAYDSDFISQTLPVVV